MKLHPIAAAIALYVAPCLSAQAPPSAQPASPPSPNALAVVVQLSKGLSAKKLKIGDRVTSRVIQDLVLAGRIVIPRDSKLIGHVTDVVSLTKTDPRSRLAMVFESGELKDVGKVPLRGVIQALAPPLPDPFLEAVMASSSPYAAGENGHPVNGAMMSTGQTNAPTEITSDHPRQSAARALEQRKRTLENADKPRSGGGGPHGALTADSHGIFGLPGLFLTGTALVPAIVASGQNVELKSGTQIVLRLDGSLLQQ